MDVNDFVKRYPTLYHMAERDSWDSILEHGLMSTSALLDLFEVDVEQRETIESKRRDECIEVRHPEHGSATIRDNKPMSGKALLKSLDDHLAPRDWYEILNRRCFFGYERNACLGYSMRELTARCITTC